MKKKFDAIVIGGGISGMLTSYFLLRKGMHVCLVESGICGKESSWAGGGIISPLYPWQESRITSNLTNHSLNLYPSIIHSIEKKTSIQSDFTKTGIMFTNLPDSEKESIFKWATEFGRRAYILNKNQTKSFEPQISDDLNESIVLPDINSVRNPRLCKGLRQYLCTEKRMLILENTEAKKIIEENKSCKGVITKEGELLSDNIVITTGAWSNKLLLDLNINLKIKPIAGQMIALKSNNVKLSTIILNNGFYLIPRNDGLIIAGSTLENTEFNKPITIDAQNKILDGLKNVVPAIESTPILHHWCGLRPSSPNNYPYVGPIISHKGLFINAGHFRNGLTLAPATAEIISNIITKEISLKKYKELYNHDFQV